jgi:ribosomal protein L9
MNIYLGGGGVGLGSIGDLKMVNKIYLFIFLHRKGKRKIGKKLNKRMLNKWLALWS